MSDASQAKFNFIARSQRSNAQSWESVLQALKASGATVALQSIPTF